LTTLPNWKIRTDGSTTDIQAPEEGPMDAWTEYLGVSVSPTEGAGLTGAFDYYIKEDFPSYYNQFKVIRQGEETINGHKAKWALFSFSNSSDLSGGGSTSATLNNLFYLVEGSEVFFYLNGIAEESHYPKYESSFLQMIRSFTPTKK
jgi:hypothetical protein